MENIEIMKSLGVSFTFPTDGFIPPCRYTCWVRICLRRSEEMKGHSSTARESVRLFLVNLSAD